jgi:glycosyltransferase involved in cell wall biosynthesis
MMKRAKKFRQAWGAWSLVKQKLPTHQYDLIEFYGDEFWLAIWQLSQLPRRPLVVAHTNGLELLDRERLRIYKPRPNLLYNWFDKQTHARFSYMAFARADAFISLCELDRKYVLSLGLYPVERTAVVEPGLDGEYHSMPFTAKKEERVAFTGTWTARKGVDNLSVVMTRILTQQQDLYFDIYGTAEVPEDTVLACFPAELHDRIVVHPRLSNQEIADGLVTAKVFFFPSQYEGFGMALAEAMACSCAAVTTPTGFGAELDRGREALVYDFNDIEAMEQAILQLLQDDELRLKIASEGWKRVRSLTWDANIKKLETLYCQWTEEHQKFP